MSYLLDNINNTTTSWVINRILQYAVSAVIPSHRFLRFGIQYETKKQHFFVSATSHIRKVKSSYEIAPSYPQPPKAWKTDVHWHRLILVGLYFWNYFEVGTILKLPFLCCLACRSQLYVSFYLSNSNNRRIIAFCHIHLKTFLGETSYGKRQCFEGWQIFLNITGETKGDMNKTNS